MHLYSSYRISTTRHPGRLGQPPLPSQRRALVEGVKIGATIGTGTIIGSMLGGPVGAVVGTVAGALTAKKIVR